MRERPEWGQHVHPACGQIGCHDDGLDGLVFTGGVGENAPLIQGGICADLGWLWVRIDRQTNGCAAIRISSRTGEVGVVVIPTNGEQVPARGAEQILRGGSGMTG